MTAWGRAKSPTDAGAGVGLIGEPSTGPAAGPGLEDSSPPPAVAGRSPAQISAGTLLSMATRAASVPIAALATALFARAVGVDAFGHVSMALGLVAILNNLGDFGLGQVILRELAARPEDQRGMTGGFVLARISSSVVLTLIGLAFVAWTVPSGAVVAAGLVVLTMPALALAGLSAVAQARLRPQWHGTLALVQAATWLCLAGLLRWAGASLAAFAAAYLVAALVQGVGAVLVARGLVSIDFSAARRHAWQLLRQSWPLGLTGLFVTAYYRLDQVLLYNIAGSTASGLYGAAYRYLDVVQLVPATLLATTLPVLARLRSRGGASFERVAHLALTLAVATAAPLAILGVLLRREIIGWLYGPEFRPAGRLLAILAPAVLSIALGYVVSGLLIVARRPGIIGWVAAPAAIVNIALNVALIPRYGAEAAAWITVATEVFVSLTTLVLMVRVTGLVLPYARLAGCAVATGAMGVSAAAVVGALGSEIVAAVASVAVFLAALGSTGALRRSDLGMLFDRRVTQHG